MDANNGKVITTLPIGDGVDAVAYDPADKLIFASNRDGTISVVREKSANEYVSVGDVQTQPSAKTMAYDAKSKRLFLSAAEMEAPAAASGGQRRRMSPKPGTYIVLAMFRPNRARRLWRMTRRASACSYRPPRWKLPPPRLAASGGG
jgi:hypothetical protein